ncbi:LacI family DNA-binding transcriptional regulator [Advenella mimigardefordensis]|uniref:Transcriptional regulator, LacI family n=1 Tax=Advenella mimigardefordensis (strain DSM 17166 / LMG 22922 / DPN7) TaxID=1247726 RepID=W0PI97_ADVMD|nr:LacI family DNA-binding transcriptional regulator [Advenella mimigardefordensis]AHG65547.1 transcriptional regulator, LacI family [Advenella mimigardefordensis DPN7]
MSVTRSSINKGSRPTVRDVARLAGVSVGTVSRVVNEVNNVTPLTRSRVKEAMVALNWKPSMLAQNMREKTSRMIGFVFSDLDNPLFSSMIKGAESVLTRAGYQLIVGSSNESPQQECRLVELFGQRQADGLIFTITDETNPDVLASLSLANFPVVMIERDVSVQIAGKVVADHYEGTLQATRYLLDLGHRRVALITGGHSNFVGRDRLLGYLQAHRDCGIEPDPALIRTSERVADAAFGGRQMQLLFALNSAPTAVLALGRRLLRGVLSACRAADIRIPQDMSLITTNDSELAELVQPAVTVVRYSAFELGCEAAHMLLHRLGTVGEWNASTIVVPTELVVRESCARPQQEPGWTGPHDD